MRKLLFLSGAQRFSDFTLLLLRTFVGLFLIWGAWASVLGAQPTGVLTAPLLYAKVSVFAQLAVGVGFVLGLFTRWAGIVCALNFIVAIVLVDRLGGFRGVFPSGVLVAIGLYLATHGAGRFSVDAALRANELPRAIGGVRFRK
jgi:putative oxidoreductase